MVLREVIRSLFNMAPSGPRGPDNALVLRRPSPRPEPGEAGLADVQVFIGPVSNRNFSDILLYFGP